MSRDSPSVWVSHVAVLVAVSGGGGGGREEGGREELGNATYKYKT